MPPGDPVNRVILTIDPKLCQRCTVCLALRRCKGNVIRISAPGEPPTLEAQYCWGCMICIRACPRNAIIRHEPDDDAASPP